MLVSGLACVGSLAGSGRTYLRVRGVVSKPLSPDLDLHAASWSILLDQRFKIRYVLLR